MFRRYDDYERALERLQSESGALDHAENGALHRELVVAPAQPPGAAFALDRPGVDNPVPLEALR